MPVTQDKPGLATIAHRHWIAAFFIYLAALWTATHMPGLAPPPLAPQIVPSDKLAHFFGYALLMLLGFAAFVHGRPNPTARLWVLSGILFLAGYVDERTQPWTGRTYDIFDVLANAHGVAAITLLLTPRSVSGRRAPLLIAVLLAPLPAVAVLLAIGAASSDLIAWLLLPALGCLLGAGLMRIAAVPPPLLPSHDAEIRPGLARPGAWLRLPPVVLSLLMVWILERSSVRHGEEGASTPELLSKSQISLVWGAMILGAWLRLGMLWRVPKDVPPEAE
ncbi:MAG: VanZ family protein [Phycisphaeraceae bacterium]|nr:VanZ family protein [Phycisphaeraceae bacterium]